MDLNVFLFDNLQHIFFYMFAITLCVTALCAVFARNTVHAVMFLILCFFESAGLFLLLNAEFLAFLMIIVYVGAVAVLFLFVVMMIDLSQEKAKETLRRFSPLVLLTALLFIGCYTAMAYKNEQGVVVGGMDKIGAVTSVGKEKTTLAEPGRLDHLTRRHLTASDPLFLAPGMDNTKKIGDVLYTEFGPLFQLCGFILLAAMIGAITLTLRIRSGVKRQSIYEQVTRSRDTVELHDVQSGAGLIPKVPMSDNSDNHGEKDIEGK